VTDEFARGRREGLRLALAVLAAEAAKWEAVRGEGGSWRTRLARETRAKTLGVAQARVRTVLNRMTPKGDEAMDAEVAAAIAEAGL
jgi:hypothetical protein